MFRFVILARDFQEKMSLLLPRIGITDCTRAIVFVSNFPQNTVGSFWIANGHGFGKPTLPDWWINSVNSENPAQAILDAYQSDDFNGHPKLVTCILVTADSSNPANISYLVQHTRMNSFEGLELLKVLAQHNIPAYTGTTLHDDFLSRRFSSQIPKELKDLHYWSVQLWEDFCSHQLAEHGQRMLAQFWAKSR
ncbi:MAG: hypothetical protein KME15_26465 [Drouetiella hepatica Uher 2000/2452]|uniref:Uncharacterized protein n=1 Tax=Drouetiella hepatica Uher 2000/2452 TaxID=904376 RepID=A0A951UQ29_9CYAN|nr:hypothetical protein [Drouetiella hepatica Uher 2000/2452]